MGIFCGGDTGAAAAADTDDSVCDGSRRYEIFVEEVSGGDDFGSNCEVQHIGLVGCALRPSNYFFHLHGHPAVLSVVGVAAVTVVVLLVWRYGKKDKPAGSRKRQALKSKA